MWTLHNSNKFYQKIKKQKRKINSKLCLNIKDKAYVDYPKENLKNYYKEI